MDDQNQDFRFISIRHIAYALAAADTGNVTLAARKLNVSQPSVSAAIAGLERHFAQSLFVRQPGQGVMLTAFGERVMRQARIVCDQARVFTGLAQPEAGASGEISISIYEALAPYVLPHLLLELERALPRVDIRFIEADLETVNEHAQRGLADLAITYDFGFDEHLRSMTLYRLRPRIVCATGHPFARRTSLALRELNDQPLILLDQPLSSQYVLGLLRGFGAVPRIAMRVRGFEVQRALVANGFGVAVMHTLPVTGRSYDGKPLSEVAISDDLVQQRVLLLSRARQGQRPLLDAAASAISEAFVGFGEQ